MSDQVREDRITKLVHRFTHIGETGMRDLPIYNHNLEVEAVGFELTENGWFGVLITPWFINAILLPEQKSAASGPLGEKLTHELASGEHVFNVGEDDEVGGYDFITLASPTLKYKSQQVAHDAAKKALTKLLTPADEYQEQIPEQAVQFVSTKQKGKQRRKFLRGLLGKDTASKTAD